MTHTATEPALARVLAATSVVLLDFDGPTADVFAGYPARDVAEHLRRVLSTDHGLALPDDVLSTDDPLHVVRRTTDLAPELVAQVDAELRAAELRAMATAEPTPGVAEFLAACTASGRPVAIVSNNSADAIRAYLDLHALTSHVRHAQGRDGTDPARMKPDPYPLHAALAVLDAVPTDAVLIGDSCADVDSARAAGVAVIAYANKPRKLQTLADADAVTTTMYALAEALPC
jgi:HAD superfamily hydrolase (TIGR01509 family)